MSEAPGQVLWRVFGYDERPLEECPQPTQDLYNGVAAAFLAEMGVCATCLNRGEVGGMICRECDEWTAS